MVPPGTGGSSAVCHPLLEGIGRYFPGGRELVLDLLGRIDNAADVPGACEHEVDRAAEQPRADEHRSCWRDVVLFSREFVDGEPYFFKSSLVPAIVISPLAKRFSS